ncbi:MAG: TIGR00266 family protein [Candidatus Fervidibacter sp.]|uniref:TIGR00266 family protein n=1 Tax=Candidatus Fervidibacter sp. TaxID=3100871 RepID=UPI0040491C5A
MQWEVTNKPSYSLLKVGLNEGEEIVAEPGAMVMMRGKISVDTGMKGGVLSSLLRSIFGGEAIFFNTFTARTKAEIWLAPAAPGDINYLPLHGNGYVLQDTSYLAHHGDVSLDIAWRGFRGWLTEGELIWLRVRGRGGVWVTAFGGIEQVEVQAGETVVVDNFHFVAMEEGANYKVRTFSGFKSFLLGGEGLVAEIHGPARLWLQTRHIASLANELLPILRRHMQK